MNKVIQQGRIVADPELKQTQNGTAVASFSIAVDRRYKDQQGNKVTDFHKCIAWKSTAEFICKYFRKGQQILILGELQNRSWEDQDGGKHHVTEINVLEVDFCGSKSEGNNTIPAEANAPYATEAEGNFEEMATDEDFPF